MAPSARGRGATIQLRPTKPSFLSRVKLAHAPRRVGARCLGGGVALELAERARRAKLIMIGVGSVIWRCTDDRRVFIGARPWCDVPAVASNTKPDASCRRRVGARCLGGGGVLLELAERARRATLLMVGVGPVIWRCADERRVFFGAWPWCDVPAMAPKSSRRPTCEARACSPALAVSGEEANHSSFLRARRTALVAINLNPRQGPDPKKGVALSACGRDAACQLWPQMPSRHRVRSASAWASRVRPLSLGRRRTTQA